MIFCSTVEQPIGVFSDDAYKKNAYGFFNFYAIQNDFCDLHENLLLDQNIKTSNEPQHDWTFLIGKGLISQLLRIFFSLQSANLTRQLYSWALHECYLIIG